MKNYLIVVFILTIHFVNNGYSQKLDSSNFDLGYVEEGFYYNDFFDFELKIPTNWDYKQDLNQKIFKKAIKDVLKDGSDLGKYVDPDEIETAILIILSKQYDGISAFQPNVIVMIENVSKSGFIKTGADYLIATTNALKLTQQKMKVSKPPYDKFNFGGKTFYQMNSKLKSAGIKVSQMYFSTIIDGFAFSAIVTYKEKQSIPETFTILNSFKFE